MTEITFKRRNHYGVIVWESNETVTDCGIELPRFRIVKEDELYTVKENRPKHQNGYHYSVNTVAEKKLKDTIYWLNINLHRLD